MIKRNKFFIIFALFAVLIIVYQNKKVEKVKTVAARAVLLENKVVIKTVSAAGKIVSENEAELSFLASQRVLKLYFKEGAEVKKGQLIAVLDNNSTSETAKVYKDARDITIRQRELFVLNTQDNKDTLGGQEQFDTKLRELDEEVSQASAQYASQLGILRGTYIYAPFDGTIVYLSKSEGESVTVGEVVVKIADLSKLVFEADIDQEDRVILSNSAPGQVELDAFPNTYFDAKLTDLPNFINNSEDSTYTARLSLEQNPESQLTYGLTGTAKIVAQQTQTEVKALYYDSIYTDEENKTYVWLLQNRTFKKFTIEIGLEGDIFTEVKTQIDGQIIIPIDSTTEVKDGYKARVSK